MTVGEAKAHAREWAAERAKQLPDFAGAFVLGSICLRRDEDSFPFTSDVDVRIVIEGEAHDIFREVDGEYRAQAIPYKGLDIEVTYFTSTKRFEDPEQIIGHYSLARPFGHRTYFSIQPESSPGSILSSLQVMPRRGGSERDARARRGSCSGRWRGRLPWSHRSPARVTSSPGG